MSELNEINREIEQLKQQLQNYLQLHWRLFLAEGAFMVFLGLCAILVPQIFTVAVVILLGWILLLAGLFHIGRALFIRWMPGFGWWLFLGALQTAVGFFFIEKPLFGALTLTMVLTMYFALEGFAKISLAFVMRPLAGWKSVLFSGATALIFALIVWFSWQQTAHWLLGLFLGLNFVLLGWSLIKISLHHKM